MKSFLKGHSFQIDAQNRLLKTGDPKKITATRVFFSVYLRGFLRVPVPMQNTLIFSPFDKKIPNQKINFVLSFNLKSNDIRYMYM